jgi:dCMP deaminase
LNQIQEFSTGQGESSNDILGEPFENYTPPSWDVYFMRLAYEVAEKSKDPSSKFGAVLVRDNRPILTGYNGFPKKVEDSALRLTTKLKYDLVVHAEQNAVFLGAKFGVETAGTTLYIPAWPCSECAKAIISAGIVKVVMHRITVNLFKRVNPKWDFLMPKLMFEETGVETCFLEAPVGKIAYLSGKKYNV